MTQQTRPIACHWGRVTKEWCKEPATVEILGASPTVLCEEHARQRIEAGLGEGWEEFGTETYARYCEEASNALHQWAGHDGNAGAPELNPVLYEVLVEALTYLDTTGLRRARKQLIAEGGAPCPTEHELANLEFFKESSARYGWTDTPPRIARIEAWAEQAKGGSYA